MTRLITLQLIETEERRGKGTEEEPLRMVRQLFTTSGELVLEYDAYTDQTTMIGGLLAHLNWIK